MTEVIIGLFVYLVGLCVGSFLNVVIYRLPRGLSIARPAWSFCPSCETTLRWFDNIPVLGWLLLRARCRYCRQPISPQYPLVEAATGLAFVLTYYLLTTAHARVVSIDDAGAATLATVLPTDAPLLLAWLVLVACLIACAAMDIVEYLIDTRVTDVALISGIVLCALWPQPEFFADRAATPGAAAAAAAFFVSLLMLWLHARREARAEEEQVDEQGEDETPARTPSATSSFAVVVIGIATFVGVAAWLVANPLVSTPDARGAASFAPIAGFLTLFVAIVLLAGQPRAADSEVHAAIEAEAPGARRAAVGELLWLTPAAIAAIGVFVLVRYVPAAGDLWNGVAHWRPISQFTPLGGAAFAIHGATIAAAAGWAIRILFTLALGREAFGVGDIYILAAAGAVAGWDIALLGFLLSIFVALAGWILGLLLKQPGMIPFGPPLALGFLLALWLNKPAAEIIHSYYRDVVVSWDRQPRVVLLGGGLLLVSFPIAIFIARLARRLIEPQDEPES